MAIRAFFVAAAVGLFCPGAWAAVIDIADGAPVTLYGEYGVLTNFCCGWNPAEPSSSGSTLTDAILPPQATVWQQGAVWWDATNPGSASNAVEVDLGGLHELRAFSVQADDNDTYRIEVRTPGNVWVTAWDIPAVGGFGLQTRPDPFDASAVFLLDSAILGDRLRFTATGGDGFYSVSEINAFVPEPASIGLVALGFATVAMIRRKCC